MKNKTIAIIIALLVFIGPFRYSFIEIDISQSFYQLMSLIITLAGTFLAMYIGSKPEKETVS